MTTRAALAARNNADLYAAIFRAHGLGYRREDGLFIAGDPPPPFYSAITITDPAAEPRPSLRAALGRFGKGTTMKDSFDSFDLAQEGLTPLFSAQWICAPPAPAALPAGWVEVTTPGDLARWERAWGVDNETGKKTRLFPDALLRDDAVTFVARMDGDDIAGGCIVNLSQAAVGISNIFGRAGDADLHRDVLAVARKLGPGRPVVGYERGDDLAAMQAVGCEAVGPLKVWIAEAA